jgi:hypothetical protein
MALRDLMNNVKVVNSIQPGNRNGSATGASVDLQGYASAMVMVSFGTWTDGTHAPILQHSSDNSNWLPCDSNNMVGSFTVVSSAAGNNTMQRVGYIGNNRYLRVALTVTAATTGAQSAATVIASRATQSPVT